MIWCRQLFVNSDDKQNDLFNNLMADDGALFRNFTLAPLISKADTNFRCSIPAKVKLYCTLRFLATGDSYRSLMYLFRISDSTISLFIPEMPSTNDGWRDVSREFDVAWNFPHCIGCVDGKHVVMQTLIMLGVCILITKERIQGRISDGGAFRETTFFKSWKRINLMYQFLSSARTTSDATIRYFGDDAFALSEQLMKPFPGLQLDKDSSVIEILLGSFDCEDRMGQLFLEHGETLRREILVLCHFKDYLGDLQKGQVYQR
nr:unnamed protein product [Callosobruchus analis]